MTLDEVLTDATLWTPADVAQYLRVSRSTVYNLVARSAIPHRRIGALIRFEPAEVKDWLSDK